MNKKTTDEVFSVTAQNAHNRLLFGTGLSAWRTQRWRRIQVVSAFAALVLYVGGALLGFPIGSLIGFLLFLAIALLLRFTTRGVADLPASVLDERQLAVRNATYVMAYRITGSLFALLLMVCIALNWMDRAQISTAAALQTLLGALFIAIVTPSCLVAWTEREA